MYIENICKKFGSFKLAKPNTPMDPARIDQYILDAIPGLAKFREQNGAMVDQKPIAKAVAGDVQMKDKAVNTAEILTVDLTENNEQPDIEAKCTTSADHNERRPKCEETPCMPRVEEAQSTTTTEQEIESYGATFSKRARYSVDTVDDPPYSKISKSNISNVEATLVDNEEFGNISDHKKSLENSLQSVGQTIECICRMNEKLQRNLNDLRASYETDVKVLNDINADLIAQMKKLKNYSDATEPGMLRKAHVMELSKLKKMNGQLMLKQANDMEKKFEKQLKDQLTIMKNDHEREMGVCRRNFAKRCANFSAQKDELNDKHRQEIAKRNAIYEHTIKRNKQMQAQSVAHAKKHKFCLTCGKSEPLDIFFCSIECR